LAGNETENVNKTAAIEAKNMMGISPVAGSPRSLSSMARRNREAVTGRMSGEGIIGGIMRGMVRMDMELDNRRMNKDMGMGRIGTSSAGAESLDDQS
jgi:hypothetical protein